jgi:hypothetical protein
VLGVRKHQIKNLKSSMENNEARRLGSGQEVRLERFETARDFVTPDSEELAAEKGGEGEEAKDKAKGKAKDKEEETIKNDDKGNVHVHVPVHVVDERAKLQRHRTARGFLLPEAGEDGIDFLNEKKGDQTLSRRIAVYLSQRYAWYNPQLAEEQQEGPADEGDGNDNDNDNKPSIEKAWAFFEHVTLNRYCHRYEVPANHRTIGSLALQEESWYKLLLHKCFRGERSLKMAEPGECQLPTKLYSPLQTPLSQLGDFGLGYGLYFSTLRAFAFWALLAGIINIPNMMYFASDEYSPGKNDLSPFLEGSAICAGKSKCIETIEAKI